MPYRPPAAPIAELSAARKVHLAICNTCTDEHDPPCTSTLDSDTMYQTKPAAPPANVSNVKAQRKADLLARADAAIAANKVAIEKSRKFSEYMVEVQEAKSNDWSKVQDQLKSIKQNAYYLSGTSSVSKRNLSPAWWDLRYEWEKVPHWWQPIYRARYKHIHENIVRLEREHGIADMNLNQLPWKKQSPQELIQIKKMIVSLISFAISFALIGPGIHFLG